MHHIQRHILKLLIENPTRRYNQLRPAQVEPNQFVYHLKQLIKQELVAKCEAGYELTPKGRAYADKLADGSYDVPWDTQPRNVLFLAVRHAQLGWLLVRRDKQPTINKIGFISTNPRLGEVIASTAEQFMRESYGLPLAFEYAGSGSITLRRAEALESYVTFHLLYAEATAADVPPSLGWFRSDGLRDGDILPSTKPLLEMIAQKGSKPIFIELDYAL